MRIDPAGLPFIGGALAVGAARRRRGSAGCSRVPFVVLAAFFLFFFRDPERQVADRRRRRAVAGRRPRAGGRTGGGGGRAARASGSRSASSSRRWTCTSTACRCRAASRASAITPGGSCRRIAATPAAANERSEIWIDHDGQTVVARQIVGMLARRVVCRLAGRRRGARRRPLRRHEIRLADGRVPAGRRRRLRVKVGRRRCAAAKRSSRCYTDRCGSRGRMQRMSTRSTGDCGSCGARGDRPRRRFRRGVYLLPSLFTIGNMFCGYACIVYAMRGEFETAAPFIGFAIVLDMLDGRIARLTGTASDFGVAVRLARRRHLVRHRAGDPVVRVGPRAARPPRLGGRLPVRHRGGDAAGALQHPERRRRRQALLRRHAEPGGGGGPGGDRVRAIRRASRLPRGAAGAGDGARAGAADGQHDPLPQLQDDRPADAPAVHGAAADRRPASC